MTGHEATRSCRYEASIEAIAGYLADLADLLRAVVALHHQGSPDLKARAITLPEVERLRLSWELIDSLMAGEELDSEIAILHALPHTVVAVAKEAVWPTQRAVPSSGPNRCPPGSAGDRLAPIIPFPG